MRITPIKFYTPQFKAHSYKIEPKTCKFEIQTDNNPYLGEKPYLIYDDYGDKREIEMQKENGLYSAKATAQPWQKDFKYHIKYQDTGKLDLKDGKEYSVDFDNLRMDAIAHLRKQYRQPMVHPFKSGSAVGKIFYRPRITPDMIENSIKEPSIVICKRITSSSINNPNVVGVILLSDDFSTLSHEASKLRYSTKICGAVYDTKIINQLQDLNGQNVEVELDDNYINFAKSNKTPTPMIYPKIKVPELEYSDKILTSNEYTLDLVGAKAVNLRRLEMLVNEGKIDVKIPKSITLTHGYIQKMFDENDEQRIWYEERKDFYPCKEAAYAPYLEAQSGARMLDLIDTLRKNGIDGKRLKVRYAFNGEDLPNYSAAGIYDSYPTQNEPKDLYENIMYVACSKWGLSAISSRQKYNIPEDAIKPSVIIQEQISPDYKFTLYTDYKDNKMRIELYSDKMWLWGEVQQPNIFTYDKKTSELTYDSIQLGQSPLTYDENFNLKELPPLKYDLSNKPEVFELIQKLVNNALVIEKEFGAPQDIEGGFADNEIYLWQTRNIPRNYDLEDIETKFLDSHLSPEMLAAKQNYLKNPNPKTYKEFTTATFQHMLGLKLRMLPHEMSNHVYPFNFSPESKYNKIKERLHLFDKFLEYNPEDKVSNLNPIDMTAVFKTFLDENNCKDIKMNGLELLENVIMGDYAFDVYYGLTDLVKFAQEQADNKNITLSFDRDGALYATVTYKGKELEEKDFYKVIPSARSYDDLDPITTNSDGEYSSIRLRLKTLDGFMVI